MATGASGECQEHVCTPSGKPKIKKITVRQFFLNGADKIYIPNKRLTLYIESDACLAA